MQISRKLHFPGVDLHLRHTDDCSATNNSLYPIFRYTINSRSTKLHLLASLTLVIPWNETVLLFIKSTFAGPAAHTAVQFLISFFMYQRSAAINTEYTRMQYNTYIFHQNDFHSNVHRMSNRVTRRMFSSSVRCLTYSCRFRNAIQTSSNFLDP